MGTAMNDQELRESFDTAMQTFYARGAEWLKKTGQYEDFLNWRNENGLSQQDTRSTVSDTESSENALKEILNKYAPELNSTQVKLLIRKINEI